MKKYSILIVEDEAVVALNLKSLLVNDGYHVAGTLDSAEAAVAFVDECRPDLILMDIVLNGTRDGIDAIIEIQKKHAVPVIYITAHSEERIVLKARATNPYGYILKPINENELRLAVNIALYKNTLEERLKASEEKYRSLIESINDVIFSVDENGIITFINGRVEESTGRRREEVIGTEFRKFIYAEDLPLVESNFLELMKGDMRINEFRVTHRDGRGIWVRASSRPVFIDGRFSGVRGVMTDINLRKESEQMLKITQFAVDNMGDEVFFIGIDGKCYYVNNTATQVLGYTREELLSMYFYEVDIDFRPKNWEERWDFLKKKGSAVLYTRLKTRGGEIFPVEEIIRYLEYEGREFAVVFARDISERRKADSIIQKKNEELEAINEELRATIEELEATNEEFEAQNQELIYAQEKLEKSQERLKYALDATSDGLWDYNIQTGVCYFSPPYYRMIGYEPGEFKASYESWRQMLHPDDAEGANEALMKHIEGASEQYQAEFRFRRKDGSYIWILSRGRVVEYDRSGKPLRVIGTHINITGRKEAEQALRESEERFRRLHEASFGGIGIHDRGIILDANRGLSEMTGFSHEELIGMNGLDLIAPEWRDTVMRHISEDYEKSYEVDGLRKDGSRYPLEVQGKVIPYKGRKVRVTEFRDITDRRQADERLKQSLNEKELLLKEIHHRVKNNMQVISSLLNLQAGKVHDDYYHRLFVDSQSRVRSMALVHEKLYQSGDMARIDFRDFMSKLISEISNTFLPADRAVNIEVSVGEVSIGIDKAVPCALILNELVSNSFKYAFGEKGGKNLSVEFRKKDDGGYLLAVSDDGPGLPAGINFNDPETLGLQLVSALARQLQGSASLDSSNGVRVVVVFPE